MFGKLHKDHGRLAIRLPGKTTVYSDNSDNDHGRQRRLDEQSTLHSDNSITIMEGKDIRLTLHSALGQIHNDHGRQRQPFALLFG